MRSMLGVGRVEVYANAGPVGNLGDAVRDETFEIVPNGTVSDGLAPMNPRHERHNSPGISTAVEDTHACVSGR